MVHGRRITWRAVVAILLAACIVAYTANHRSPMTRRMPSPSAALGLGAEPPPSAGRQPAVLEDRGFTIIQDAADVCGPDAAVAAGPAALPPAPAETIAPAVPGTGDARAPEGLASVDANAAQTVSASAVEPARSSPAPAPEELVTPHPSADDGSSSMCLRPPLMSYPAPEPPPPEPPPELPPRRVPLMSRLPSLTSSSFDEEDLIDYHPVRSSFDAEDLIDYHPVRSSFDAEDLIDRHPVP